MTIEFVLINESEEMSTNFFFQTGNLRKLFLTFPNLTMMARVVFGKGN